MSLRYKGAVISATPPTTTGGESGVASGSWTLEQQFQAQGAGNWPEPFVAKYIEDVFSTYLYTNNTYPSNLTITNGIDLSGKGGLVWMKNRNLVRSHNLYDTARGAYKQLRSDSTGAQITNASGYGLTAFNADGFSLGTDIDGENYGNVVSWTFRKQPKFFDVQTFTSNSSNGGTFTHNLGAVPGCLIVKSTAATDAWLVWHRGLTGGLTTNLVLLNTTGAQFNSGVSLTATDTSITIPNGILANASSGYVAYLFAHDAGGFGLTGTDNVISCGSATATAGTWTDVNVGFEPQWVLIKNSTATGSYNPSGSAGSQDWYVIDTMRGATAATGSNTSTVALSANSSIAEYNDVWFGLTSTGFSFKGVTGGSDNFIYIAIRRGPMKVPTSGTSVYQANTYTGNATANTTVAGNFGFPVDLLSLSNRDAIATNWSTYGHYMIDRLRGQDKTSGTANSNAESAGWSTYNAFDVQNSIGWGLYGASSNTGYMNYSGGTYVARGFRRAPSFFDEVCYTGTGTPTNFTHNLGVVPELMIVKRRNASSIWAVYAAPLANASTSYLELSEINAVATGNTVLWNSTSPTSTVFTIGSSSNINTNGSTNVAYLFATCAGVSKVGSYTGTGTTLQVNCGFTGGARFVLIKRTDSTGDWYVWDSARGIVSGNDPYLLLNSTAAEVTSTDYVDTYSAGFEITSTAPAAINASGGTFIFLAIA